jgi:hypothetical protein
MVPKPPKEELFFDDSPVDDDYPKDGSTGDDFSSVDDEDSQVSSVPTTVQSNTDEMAAASILAAQKESHQVFLSKLTGIGLFFLVAIVLSVAVYGFATGQEEEDFQKEVSDPGPTSDSRNKNVPGDSAFAL